MSANPAWSGALSRRSLLAATDFCRLWLLAAVTCGNNEIGNDEIGNNEVSAAGHVVAELVHGGSP